MNDDDLRARLRRADPLPPDAPIDPGDLARARTLMEDAMTQTLDPPQVPTPAEGDRPNRVPMLIGAAAAAVLIVALAAFALSGGDDPATDGGDTLVIGADAGFDPALASCIAFDPAFLADMDIAFAATATTVDGDQVTFEVDRWFTGGDAARVQMTATPGMEALIGVPEIVKGERYLITATNPIAPEDGGAPPPPGSSTNDTPTVNGCGFSGLATPEFEAALEDAFG